MTNEEKLEELRRLREIAVEAKKREEAKKQDDNDDDDNPKVLKRVLRK